MIDFDFDNDYDTEEDWLDEDDYARYGIDYEEDKEQEYRLPDRIQDSVNKLFNELEKIPTLIVRHDAACCSSCSLAQLESEASATTLGYVFYHNQDIEFSMRSNELAIRYASHSGKDEDTKKIADLIIEACQKNRIYHNWNGSINTVIYLTER